MYLFYITWWQQVHCDYSQVLWSGMPLFYFPWKEAGNFLLQILLWFLHPSSVITSDVCSGCFHKLHNNVFSLSVYLLYLYFTAIRPPYCDPGQFLCRPASIPERWVPRKATPFWLNSRQRFGHEIVHFFIMRIDRIILGKIRDAAACELLSIMSTGHGRYCKVDCQNDNQS